MKSTNSLPRTHVARLLVLLAILFSLSVVTGGQTESSQYDHGTPPQHAAGVSAIGSYISTDLGTINLSNGALNFRVPLATVGGRGFSLPLTLNYSSKVWSGFTGIDSVTEPIYRTYKAAVAVYDSEEAAPEIYQRVAPGWTLGGVPMLRVRGVGISTVSNGPCGSDDYLKALTKLTLMLPDKGEIELRDDYTDGSPLGALTLPGTSCRWMDGNRGQRWHATDGSGITFISDAANGVINGDLNGWLITGEGMRYRFVDTAPSTGFGSVFLNEFARAASVTDRNGNRVDITYSINPLRVSYSDQLGRITTVEYGVLDPSTGETLAARISTPGYNGQSHQYKVRIGLMNQNYRAGINPTLPVYNGYVQGMDGYESCGGPPQTYSGLFASWCGGAERLDDRAVLTQLVLPDNRALTFRYNEYGEVAEVETPTAGKVQYDYAYENGMPSGNSPAFEVNPSPGPGNVTQIDRAVKARRAYTDGVNLSASWSYEYTATAGVNGAASNGVAEVIATAPDNSIALRQKHYFLDAARFIASNGGTGYSLWSTSLERRSETLDASGTTVIYAGEQDWSQRAGVLWSYYPSEQIANDNRINEERKILDSGNTSKVDTFYQVNVKYNNPIEVQEFDFDQSLKRRATTTYADSSNLVNGLDYTSDSIHLLSLPLAQTVYDGSNNQVAQNVYEYDAYSNDNNHAPLQDYGSVTQHNTTYGSSYLTRGNLTRLDQWLNTTNSFLHSFPRYDDLGNVVAAKDAKGNVSTISFADDFGDGSNPGGGGTGPYGATYALPTLITSPPPQTGQPQQTARTQYDFSTGLLAGFKDRNGIISQTIYNDPFDRPTLVKSALGISGVESHAAIYYAPTTAFGISLTNNDVLTAKDQTSLDDATLRSWTHTDGFGRTVEAWSRDPQGDVKVVSVLDALGRTKQVSNPYRPSLGETPIYTATGYDLAGRVISVTTPDSATVNTAYTSNRVLVADQTGRKRISVTDGLGRLKEVWEVTATDSATEPISFPGYGDVTAGYVTRYSYDTLDHLTNVSQRIGTNGATQSRSFAYDSLKRLTSAQNPESGVICYGTLVNSQCQLNGYDANGNLVYKTDARGILATYVYDALNRNTTITYTNDPANTPSVTRTYDNPTTGAYGKGRLWSTQTSASTLVTIDNYDALGRTKSQKQQFYYNNSWSEPYSITEISYDRAGHLLSEKYPSGRTVTNVYDSSGRLSSFSGDLGGGNSRAYSTGLTYASGGQMMQEQFGTTTPVYNKLFYNSRQQLAEILASTTGGDASYNRGKIVNDYSLQCSGAGCNATDNSGNLRKQTVSIPNNDQNANPTSSYQQYEYDSLNRLQLVHEHASNTNQLWQQKFVYDRYGNRTIDYNNTSLGIPRQQFSVNPANNRLGVPSGQSGTMSYDNAGNLTTDTYSAAAVTRVYDAENRMTSENQGGSLPAGSYSYDADGHRVKRIVGSTETWQVYGLGGELIAEYAANTAASSPQKEYGYRNGQLLVTAEPASSSGGGGGGSSGTNTNSLSLDGTGYVSAANSSSLTITSSLTLEAWIKLSSAGSLSQIVSRYTNADGGYQLGTYSGKLRMDILHSGSSYNSIVGSTAISINVWHHVAGVFDGSQYRLYVDGVLDASSSTTYAPGAGTGSLAIGRDATGGQNFSGLMDEVRVSNAAIYTSSFTPSSTLTASSTTAGLWRFDGQTASDSSSNGNNGALNGGAAYSTDTPSGSGGGGSSGTNTSSLSLDGTGYVSAANSSSLTITSSLTLEAWIKLSSAGSLSQIVSRYTNADGGYQLGTYSGKLRMDILHSGSAYNSIVGATVISINVWHHVAGVFDGSQYRLYVDGVLDASSSTTYAPGTGTGTGSLAIGRDATGGQNFSGLVDEVRVSNAAIYTSSFTPSSTLTASSTTAGLWRFDGQTASDSSSNGNNGALNGGATYSTDTPSGSGGGSSGSTSAQIHWLVADQLGTPRMIFDQSGSLTVTNQSGNYVSGMTRHDYLPFGEELFGGPPNQPGMGGRTTTQGYSGDSTRQKFTSKERDNETGLDWFGPGRYYSSTQGRFTSVDPLGASAKPANPQTWNRYSYVWNRPTIAIDPDGLSTIVIVVAPRSSGGTGSATTSVYDRDGHARNLQGRDANTVVGSAVGATPNRMQRAIEGVQRGGDTPFGVYSIFHDQRANANGTQGGVAGQSARGDADLRFGTGIIYMQPVSGEVVDAGRSTIYLHGGGRPLDQALDDYQRLTPTDGCVRYYNADINALIGTVNDLANNDHDPVSNIFIGDATTLNAQAEQRDRNGNYLYPELRSAGFGNRNDAQGRPPGNPPQEERDEREDE